jgi:hypothetical protein
MTTVAQVKALVKPLLDRHSDLALVGRYIYLKPVHHFARAVLIDRKLDPDQFNPRWAVMHLFAARRFFALNWGEFLDNEKSDRPGIWRISEPDLASAMIDQIERNALPRLRAMKTLDDYFAFVSQHRSRHQLYDEPTARIIVEAALGHLEATRVIGADNLALWSRDEPYYDEVAREKYRRLRELCACLAADDRRGIARLLHEWEAHTVKKLRIEHLWQPTPFPLELQPAHA